MRILYLHGFASSPASRKAEFFRQQLAKEGLSLQVPELAPDFQNLTITGQLAVVEEAVAGESAILIGSSLGGYLAAIYASGHPNIRRLLLLAPAFGFVKLWEERLGAERLGEWQSQGALRFYHYGVGQELRLGYGLMADARQYPPEPGFGQPALVVHGNQDDTVPVENSIRYATGRPNVRLQRFDSGHELTDVLMPVWQASRDFLLDPETHI